MSSGKVLTVALTGASGAMLTRELLLLLEKDSGVERVHFVASESSLRVLAEELEVSGRKDLVAKLLGQASVKIVQHAPSDIGAPIASGSYPCDGMIVLPCSMGTLAGIANGLADNLIARAADAGATIFPVIPVFYNHPVDTLDMARQFVCRVLAHIGLPQNSAYQWTGKSK